MSRSLKERRNAIKEKQRKLEEELRRAQEAEAQLIAPMVRKIAAASEEAANNVLLNSIDLLDDVRFEKNEMIKRIEETLQAWVNEQVGDVESDETDDEDGGAKLDNKSTTTTPGHAFTGHRESPESGLGNAGIE
jgi:hypothetical protein